MLTSREKKWEKKNPEIMSDSINSMEQNYSFLINKNLVISFREARYDLAFHLTLFRVWKCFCYVYYWRIIVEGNLLCKMAGFCSKCLHSLALSDLSSLFLSDECKMFG